MITELERRLEMSKLEIKVSRFNEVQKIYRGQEEVPRGKTWVEICDEYEVLLKSVVRYDYLKQCTYKVR